MHSKRKQILLTNDDGIKSPGLWAAAEVLSSLGFVTITAPRDQVSGSGRSLPNTSDGQILPTELLIKGQRWVAYAVGGTPAQVVQHAVLEIMPSPPDLVVAGINYGENLGQAITASGTLGAAMEAAVTGFPALAVSLQVLNPEDYYNYARLDFSIAAHFTGMFAKIILNTGMPEGVDFLKLEVPAQATRETPWRLTTLARHRYYQPYAKGRQTWKDASTIRWHTEVKPGEVEPDSDVHTVLFDHEVAVTPLTLDMTARIDMGGLQENWENALKGK